MAVKDSYSKARAKKQSASRTTSPEIKITKSQKRKVTNKVKKSPILIIALIALLVGLAGGYFAFTSLSGFDMAGYSVNGVASEEKDYVIVDVSEIKDKLELTDPDVTMEELYASVELVDEGVTCKFFGVDVSASVSTKYYYREDISHDATQAEGIDLMVPGVYYIEYTSSHFAFKSTTLIRTIVVTGVENDG